MTEHGSSWRDRAGRMILDPDDSQGRPVSTPVDRRWLWRVEHLLATCATNDPLRQLAADLRAYLNETCEHHWITLSADECCPEMRQCTWCCDTRDASEFPAVPSAVSG